MRERGFPQDMNQSMAQKYSIPDGMRVYAIGDVHGHLDALERLHEEISADLIKRPVDEVHMVYLGDYIDRGPDSRGVIDYLIERKGRGDGIAKTFLAGNHEYALFDFMKDPVGHDWLRYGGVQTLASYGMAFEGGVPLPAEIEAAPEQMAAAISGQHFEFYRGLDLSLEIGDYMFVHAGVDPAVPMTQQSQWALTRMREPFLSWHKDPKYKPLEKRVVHGHTMVREPEVLPHRVNVDTGMYDGGALTAGVFEGADVRFIQVR